jgi:hypothetical protein
VLGDLRERSGDLLGARDALEEGLALAREAARSRPLAIGLALLAALPGGDVAAARAAQGSGQDERLKPQGAYLLWRASGDPNDLAEARARLEARLARIPPSHHDAVRSRLRIHREILAASGPGGA